MPKTHWATPCLACNFPGHAPSPVHTGTADSVETGRFLQPLQTRAWFLPKTELKPVAHELHSWCWQGEHSCPLSSTPESSPSALYPSCQSSPCPLPGTGKARMYPPSTISLLRREATSFPFCLCPSFLPPIQKALLKTGRSPVNSCLIVWIMERCLCPPRVKDSISKMSFPMK